jgi:DNA polymerase-4
MPEKIIYHIDVNSAFLSWEACRQLKESPQAIDIRNIPAVIGGNEQLRHGVVLAKSISAKKYGIRTGESLLEARKKCPGLVVVPPNYGCYVATSRTFIEYLRQFAPSVEQYSIDEAFCDMTGTEALYGSPIVFANQLKDAVYKEFGFTVNIGISSNKLLAKMASDFKKPNLVHTLFPSEIKSKMWPLPVGELFFVGQTTQRKLVSLGIHTIGDVARCDKQLLINHFKKHGETIWNYANGLDVEIETNHHHVSNKSYGNSITIHFDVTDSETARTILLSLCETVGARIRASKAYIGVVCVTIVDNEFNRLSRQRTLDTSTNVTEDIYKAACTLFNDLWDKTPIRQLGVSTSHATEDSSQQVSLFNQERTERLTRLNQAIDDIRDRFGEDSIKRARFIGSDYDHMSGGLSKEKRNGVTGTEV